MLSAILSKEDCAKCRFCCSFRRTSLWETPIFTEENILAIKNSLKDTSVLNEFDNNEIKYATYDLSDKYLTSNPDEEVPCPYLDQSSGCILNNEEKPWDCKIWPLRILRKADGKVVVALTPTCPSINSIDIEKIRDFVNDNLKEDLLAYANAHPYLIKNFRDGWNIEL